MDLRQKLLIECFAEFLGTWLMVFLGTATIATSVTTGAQVGIWQIAVLWGFGITLSIFLSSHVSGAHLNPAVTLSLGLSKMTAFPRWKMAPYIVAQLLGSIFSGACVLLLYGSAIARYEEDNQITRGDTNSTLTAMIFGEYFPNPQFEYFDVLRQEDVSILIALAFETVGTMLLMVFIRALTDESNGARPSMHQAPFYIGFGMASVMSVVGPFTQAGLNPARDFGPRIVAASAGWSSIAIPGPRNGFWVYIVGPVFGALIGGWIYDYALRPAYMAKLEPPLEYGLHDHERSLIELAAKHHLIANLASMHGMDGKRGIQDSPNFNRLSSPGILTETHLQV